MLLIVGCHKLWPGQNDPIKQDLWKQILGSSEKLFKFKNTYLTRNGNKMFPSKVLEL
jgi:hypothetical protein